MKIGMRRFSCLLFTGLLAFITCTSRVEDNRNNSVDASIVSEGLGSSFVARLIRVEPEMSAGFTAHLHDCYLPTWNRLHDAGVVATVSVFELNHYDSTATNASAEDFLVLAGLNHESEPNDLFDAEKSSACAGHPDAPGFSVRRSALMQCTPNSCHGSPEPAYEDATSGIDFLVEFIGVEETRPALAKYQEIVSKYAGPANGILVQRGMLHCFVALENVAVLSDTPGAVPWNQIHISDDWDEGGQVDWDSVYTELFRSEFASDLDSVWAEIPRTDDTRADYHGKLISMLGVR